MVRYSDIFWGWGVFLWLVGLGLVGWILERRWFGFGGVLFEGGYNGFDCCW